MRSAGFYYNIAVRWLTVACKSSGNTRNCLSTSSSWKRQLCCTTLVSFNVMLPAFTVTVRNPTSSMVPLGAICCARRAFRAMPAWQNAIRERGFPAMNPRP